MNALYMAHSGIRYLVLLAGLVAVVVLTYAIVSRRPMERGARTVTAVFTGVLDLQILLGVGLLALYVSAGRFYGGLIGHLVMMVLAAGVAHGASVMARNSADARRALTLRVVGVVVALVLIVGGIAAIQRGIFQSIPLAAGG